MLSRTFALAVLPLLPLACGANAVGPTAAQPAADAGVNDAPAPRPPAADPASWRKTGSLKTGRCAHTATLLSDGRVLAVGGENVEQKMLASVEIFDPLTEEWTAASALAESRSNHVAVRLADGKVLIAGGGRNAPIGQPLGEGVTASALLFDPKTDTFAETGSMHHARSHFGAVRLPSGHVLAVGGGGDEQESAKKCAGQYCGPFGKALATAELYDPATGQWTEVAAMTTPRFSFSLTALPSGKVIAVGGVNEQAEGAASTEIFDPASMTWSPGPSLAKPREHHSAALLGTGRLIIVGGKNPNVSPLSTVELLDPELASWEGGRSLSSPRTAPGLVALESGHVLVSGGFDQTASKSFVAESVIYDDEAKTRTTIRPLATGRLYQTTTLLADGRVLVAGGRDDTTQLSSCEIGAPAEPTEGGP